MFDYGSNNLQSMASKTQFLFVHDTVEKRSIKIDDRDPIVAKAIRKHLQRHNRKTKLVGPECFLTRRVPAPVGWRKRSSRESSNDSTTTTTFPFSGAMIARQDKGPTAYDSSPHLAILQRGNSDPFNSFSVQVTARVNQVMLFYHRDFLKIPYTSAIVASDTYRFVLEFRAIEAANDRNDIMNVLKDEFCASGFLLAHMTMLAAGSKDSQMALDVATLKTQLYARLQARIETQSKVDEIMVEAVLQLFNASVYSRDIVEARVHGNCLLRLLQERQWERIKIVLLFRIAYTDIGLAATLQSYSIMDKDGWMSAQLRDGASRLQEIEQLDFPDSKDSFNQLDGSIPVELKAIFAEARKLLQIWWTQPAAHSVDSKHQPLVEDHPQASLYRWLYAQIYAQSYALVDYLAQRNRGHDVDARAGEHVLLYTGKVLATALLALISATSGKILDVHYPIRPGTYMMISHLLIVVDEASALLEVVSYQKNNSEKWEIVGLRRALLWACTIGNLIGHLHAEHQKQPQGLRRNFEHVCHEMILSLDLSSCEEIENVLGGFVYHADLQEAGKCRQILKRYFSAQNLPHV